MKRITIQAYSKKGLVIQGATQEQALTVVSKLGENICTQFNAALGGWVFSRKREDRIREIVKTIQPAIKDDLPGKWGPLAA